MSCVQQLTGDEQLFFNTLEVANNSYVRAGDIPPDSSQANGLFCTNLLDDSSTRQWFAPNWDPLLTSNTRGPYQSVVSGGAILYVKGGLNNTEQGVYTCIITDSTGNVQSLHVGLYNDSTDTNSVSGKANGKILI